MTAAPTRDHPRMCSALASDVRNTRSGSAPVTSTSPLPYQSNSGPTVSDRSAMKPSSDMVAAMMTFPIPALPRSQPNGLSTDWLNIGRHIPSSTSHLGCQDEPVARDLLINLHTHLEGRVRPETAADLAAASGLPEPAGGWEQALKLAGPADLSVFLAKVNATYPFFGSV